jgi:hypothetical protein
MKDTSVNLLNQHPVNQHSLALLQKLKVQPDPSNQYVFQLLEWGRRSGQVPLHPKYRQALEGTLEELVGHPDPQEALNYLLLSDKGELKVRDKEFQAVKDPQEAAAWMWEELHSKLGATLQGYHTQPPT